MCRLFLVPRSEAAVGGRRSPETVSSSIKMRKDLHGEAVRPESSVCASQGSAQLAEEVSPAGQRRHTMNQSCLRRGRTEGRHGAGVSVGRVLCREKQDEEQTRDSKGERVHVEQEVQPRDPADHQRPNVLPAPDSRESSHKLLSICPIWLGFWSSQSISSRVRLTPKS